MADIPPDLIPTIIELYKIPVRPYSTRYAYMWLHPDQKEAGYKAVLVEADRFLDVWDKHNVMKNAPLATDRRLLEGWADVGFTKGANNPVPLAQVAYIQDGSLRLQLGNARVIWLLVHGAWAFPLACPVQYCAELQRLAGL